MRADHYLFSKHFHLRRFGLRWRYSDQELCCSRYAIKHHSSLMYGDISSATYSILLAVLKSLLPSILPRHVLRRQCESEIWIFRLLYFQRSFQPRDTVDPTQSCISWRIFQNAFERLEAGQCRELRQLAANCPYNLLHRSWLCW